MKNKKQLTIIIPFLNEGEEVRNTIKSIREHSNMDEVDILLINDASNDKFDYEAIAKEFNVEYHTNPIRLGVAASRDLGVELCKTKYFLFLDAHILMQSFTNFELIIVDDGSTDNTTNIVRSYKDKRIKLHQNFHSFIQTLNLGIKLSKGKYIARMDADDIMKFHRLEVQFEYMESNSEVDICGSWMETFGEEFQCIKTPVKHNDIVVTLIKNNALCHPTIIMRRESLQRFEHFPYIYNEQFIYAEDYKLWTDLIIAGFKFSNISKVLLKYRISNSQNTVRFASRMKENSVNIQKNYLNFISEKIVEFDSTLFDFLNRAINLHNSNYLTFNALQQISLDIIKRQLTESNAKYKI